MWRKRRLDQMQQLAEEGRAAGLHDEAAAIDDVEDFERPTTLVLAYDSQYTRDMCDVGDGAPPSRKNTTVVTLCRRLLHEAVNCGIKVVWVKVRGHSGDAGNDRADSAATA